MEISLHVTIFSASIVTYTRQALYLLVSRVKIVSKKRTNRPVEPGKPEAEKPELFNKNRQQNSRLNAEKPEPKKKP